jgi:hypothetical protein
MFMFEGGAKSKAQQARAARVQERRARVTRPQGAPDVQALQTVRNMLENIVPRGQVSSVSHPTQPTTPAAGDVQDIEVDETSFPLPEDDDTSYLTPGGAIDIDVEESPSSQIRATPQDTVDAEAEQEDESARADEEQGVTGIDQDTTDVENPAQNEADADVERLAAELEKKAKVTTDADRKREAKERAKADKERETPHNMDEDKEGDAEARKIRIAAEKVRKKSNDAIDKLGGMLGQMDTDDPEEQRAAAERIKEQIKQQEDFWDGFGVVEMDLDFTNDDGEFDQGKYDAFRDIVAESYAQQMKRLKASTRLLKRLRKDKTRIELPKLPGWQYLPGDRRIWTDPYAVSAEVAYPKDGFVSQGGPQSVFGFGR